MTGIIFGISAITLAVTLVLFRANIKGYIGEKVVSVYLKTLPSASYKIINDLILPTRRGTSQVDHVVISKYGIFVIETKNYKGWISGHENSEKWTQNIYGNKFKLSNPVRQNQSHIRAIQNSLSNIGQFPMISIIAFSSNASLNVSVGSAYVIYWKQIASTIRRHRTEVISDEQVQRIISHLRESNVTTGSRKKDHTKRVRQVTAHYESMLAVGICPRCGGRLVERNGMYGSFFGCSNYPRCKFTHR